MYRLATPAPLAAVAFLSLIGWPLAASAQDAAIMKEVGRYNQEATALMAAGEQAFEAGNAGEACARYGEAVGKWRQTGARFEDFVVTNPSGPKDRQAATRKNFADRRIDAEARVKQACGKKSAGDVAFDNRVQGNLDSLAADLTRVSGLEAQGDAALAKVQSAQALGLYLQGFQSLSVEFFPRLQPIQQEVLARGTMPQKTRLLDIMDRATPMAMSLGGKMSRICRAEGASFKGTPNEAVCTTVLKQFPAR